MTQELKYTAKSPLSDLKNSFQNFLSAYTKKDKAKGEENVVSENRYSVLYTLKSQYHHIGCSSQAEAQSVLGLLMTDGNRIPVGIYDEKTDTFEWEIIGQYFHSQDSTIDQNSRLEEILTISRALRRRDSSWQPGYLQKPSFFA
ncbi:hypothetical protein [Dyadobacter sp. CY356]|uniref:hypothetical protein n=1 Tax=Dyadobacter sp. CY356 TaxID=2906442 RepID=UPI001F278FB6|nr:hypothetical protein [Dyadobacter sp. CY356]MCF0055000.1 hypothetical protein [Dyadobacter sp. CY356]